MTKIQPLSVWKNGTNRTATTLKATIGYDDLATAATFYYTLTTDDSIILAITEEIQTEEGPQTIVVSPQRIIEGEVLVSGSVQMSGLDYDNWGTSGIGANEEAYNYIAAYLNVTIIP